MGFGNGFENCKTELIGTDITELTISLRVADRHTLLTLSYLICH